MERTSEWVVLHTRLIRDFGNCIFDSCINDNTHFHAVHSLKSMACYTFFVGHTANFVLKMIQVLTKISSWTQKCVDFSGTLVLFLIGQKIKELF